MTRTPSLTARLGYIDAQATFVQAALLAAHGAGTRAGGFRASDVRFFFLLFTNWVEHDVTRPSQDIDLTQVRRTLVRLCHSGLARKSLTLPLKGGPRGQRFVLSGEGLVLLAEGLTARDRLPLEEALFIACFSASYRRAVLARVEGQARAPSAAVRRRVEQALNPRRILRETQRTAAAVLADLEERVASGLRFEALTREAFARGAAETEVVQQMERLGAYQLHRVRPLGELLLGLPVDLRRFEVNEGMALRSRLLFAPLAERARAEVALLERLTQQLSTMDAGKRD